MHPWFILGVLSFFSFGIQAQECRIASFEKEQILNEWMDKTKESTAYVKLKKDISRLGQSKVKFYEEQLMKFTSGDMCYSTTLMRKVEEYLTFLGEDILCFEDLSIDLLNLFLEDSKKLFLENLNQEILEIQNVYDFNILLRTSDLAYSNIENIQDLTSALRERLSSLDVPHPQQVFEQLEVFYEPNMTFTEFDELISDDYKETKLKQKFRKRKRHKK